MTRIPEIRPDHLRIVQGILRRHLPDGVRVWVFGSRARGGARTWADLDLALEGSAALDEDTLLAVTDAFAESELSLRVDVVDLGRVSERFRRIVESERTPLPGRAIGG